MSDYNSDINPKTYYGCALEINDPKRLEEFQEQRKERGFDDSETWSLDITIVKFMLPRLKRLIEIEKKIGTNDVNYFKDMEEAIKLMENYDFDKTDLMFFFKRFGQLWW